MLRRERPSCLREKAPFKHEWFERIFQCSRRALITDSATGFALRTAYAQMALCFEQLLRLNEVADRPRDDCERGPDHAERHQVAGGGRRAVAMV